MSNIANLSVMLSLDGAGFSKGLEKATGQLKQWAAGIGAAFSVRALTNAIRELENVGDAAASAGVGIEAFTRITGALDAEDTAAATLALQRLGKALAEISTGNQATADKLTNVGLDPKELIGLGIEGSLRKIAKAYADAEDPIKKLAIAQAAFGKAAVSIIPVLDQLNSGTDDMANRFGKFLSEEDLGRIAQAKDALTSLDNALAGIKNRLAIELTPVVEEIVKGFGMMADALSNLLKSGRDDGFGWFDAVKLGMQTIVGTVAEGAGIVPEGTLNTIWKAFKEDHHVNRMKFFDLQNSRKARSLGNSELFTESEKQKMFVKGTVDLLEKGLKTINGWADAMQDFNKSVTSSALEIFQNTRSPLEKFRQEMLKLEAMRGFGRISPQMFNRSLGQMVMDKVRSNTSFTQTSPTLLRGSQEAGSFISQFEQRREGVKTLETQMVDIFKQMLDAEHKQTQQAENIGRILNNKLGNFKVMGIGN